MITKIIFKVHPLFYLVGFICFLTGFFKEFIIFSSIILVHELGHITVALLLKWNIDRVILLPFGGITIFNEHIDKSLLEEFLIAIAGPVFQVLFFIIFNDNKLFFYYNSVILLFNLLPIYPLDGIRVINIFLNCFFSFKFSHFSSIFLSYLFFFLFLFIFLIKSNLSFAFISIFLFIEIIKESCKHKYYFNKFLLERYLYNFQYKRIREISCISKMKKQTHHIFKFGSKYYTEREIIRKIFDI